MANILVLIPVRPTLPPALLQSARQLLGELRHVEARLGTHQLDTHISVCEEAGDGRPYSAHAAARNAMLDAYLDPGHTHVLWIDADLVDYPRDLASTLHQVAPDSIVAPFALIENTDRFYDTRGFVDRAGAHAAPRPPYLEGGDLVSMASVGCCYLAPASLYLSGVRYRPTDGHTEHWSVCDMAHLAGLSVWAARRVVVSHANLPNYGEAWHAWPMISPA